MGTHNVKYKVTPGVGTIPTELCVTNLKPDIVIIDEHQKVLHIFELTMPLNHNIELRHSEKMKKYAPFIRYYRL